MQVLYEYTLNYALKLGHCQTLDNLVLDEFMEQEIAEYEIGKRFLANMMGEDPNDFEQDKIDVRASFGFKVAL